MKLDVIATATAPAAIGPYSQAIRCGEMLYCSGQIPLDPVSGEVVSGGVTEQAVQVMKNIKEVLSAAGTEFGKVVKTTVFLVDMNDFAAFNKVYAEYFDAHKPARSTVAVKSLPRNVLLEVEVMAYV